MTAPDAPPPDWKLQLRYGQLKTPFGHFTALAEGMIKEKENAHGCPVGPAWMAMKTWAIDAAESADMTRAIGSQFGFEVSGHVQIFDSEPAQPPGGKPFGYDISFTPFEDAEA